MRIAAVVTILLSGLTTTTGVAAAAAAAGQHLVTAPELCCGWVSHPYASTLYVVDDAPADVSFAIHAKETGRDAVERVAQAVSDPASPHYGEYLSAAAIDAMTAPDPADVRTIRAWIDREAGPRARVEVHRGRRFVVTLPRSDAERLLHTKFEALTNTKTGQRTARAGDYTLPADVHWAMSAIYGLHGLPLPPRRAALADPGNVSKPANVTPAVIRSQYSVAGVTPRAASKNKQAVAEFAGQTMNSTDLKQFFAAYVPGAPAGADTVSKFVGDPGEGVGKTEPLLDIQYIMGVAPGIATEFWLFGHNSDFCGDLKNWTSTLLADEDPPLVTSVSYGYQGNVTFQLRCQRSELDAVDDDLAKLAARGITIVFASGDSGSGDIPVPDCYKLDEDTTLEGTVLGVANTNDVFQCCTLAAQKGDGFTYDGPSKNRNQSTPRQCKLPELQGVAFQGKAAFTYPMPNFTLCCFLGDINGAGFTYAGGNCTVYETISGTVPLAGATSARNKLHKCTVFSKVTGQKPAKGILSANDHGHPKIQLWPSWPASSPWVTAVGATRFVGQQPGNAEMASDQFGSGGGFSKRFGQSPNATWQSKDVAQYLKIVPKGPPLPPAYAYDVHGRATPDVATLGEGYQVIQGGRVLTVGGTSASAPTFAGLISLLNEHQLQNGKKPLGFLNPWLYANAQAFTDVTQGTNAIGRGTGPVRFGFNCTKGWDPATGLGTPVFEKLVEALP